MLAILMVAVMVALGVTNAYLAISIVRQRVVNEEKISANRARLDRDEAEFRRQNRCFYR